MPSLQEMIERLHKKRAELLEEAARLDDAITALRSTAYLFGEDEAVAEQIVKMQYSIDPDVRSVQRSATVVQPEDIARLARRTLIEHGRPAKRGLLVRLMEKQNIPLTGRDKSKNLGTILWRFNKQFVNIDGYGYWPRDIAFEEVYDPQNPPDGVKYVALSVD